MFSTFIHGANQLMLSRTAVLTDQLYAITVSKDTPVYRYNKQPPSRIDCLIVGKEHYSEKNRAYPLQSAKELRKILQLEVQSCPRHYHYMIGPYRDGQRVVTSWQIEPSILTGLDIKPLLILPESALLLPDKREQLLTLTRGGRTFWLTRRQGQLLSVEKKGLIASKMMFLASAGINEQIESVELNEHEYLATMVKALVPIGLKHLLGFKTSLRTVATIDWPSHLKLSGGGAVILLLGYFALGSLYLNIRLNIAQQESAGYRESTQAVFTLNNQVAALEKEFSQLAAVVNQVNSPSIIWRVLAPLATQGITVKKLLMLPSGQFVVDLEADKATQVLALFSRDSAIIAAKFRGQSTVVKDKERFSISFTINRGA